MGKFIHVRAAKFGIQPGEQAELVNDGTYGKALAEYLRTKLIERGYAAPYVCCEDWGWWVELKTAPFAFGVCIYGIERPDGSLDLCCTDGAAGPRCWNWKQFRFLDTRLWAEKLHADLLAIFGRRQRGKRAGRVG